MLCYALRRYAAALRPRTQRPTRPFTPTLTLCRMALARRYDDFFRRAAVVAVADSSGGPSGVRGVRGALTTLPAAHGAAARVPRDRVCTLGRPCMRVRVHAVQLRTCQATWVAPPARAGSVMGWSVGVPELTGASGTRVAVALSPVRAPLRPAPPPALQYIEYTRDGLHGTCSV